MNIAFLARLTSLALVAALILPVAAAPPTNTIPPNTAQQAGEAVTAFLPGQVKPVAPKLPDLPDAGPLPDLTAPAAAVHQALGAALAALTANRPDNYAAMLDTAYAQPPVGQMGKGTGEIGKAETARRLREMLARNRCAEASFGIADFRLETPDQALVTVRERLTCLSRNTPPTYLTTSDGRVAVINNTSTLTATLLLSQTWVRRGPAWRLKRSETLAAKMTAVL